MFEKLRPREDGGPISSAAYNLLETMGFYHKEEITYAVIIEDVAWDFRDEDTYLAICKENPDYSCIVNMVLDEEGEIMSGKCIYNQPYAMADMERLGFGIVEESLEEAERNYRYFYEFPAYDLQSHGEISLN